MGKLWEVREDFTKSQEVWLPPRLLEDIRKYHAFSSTHMSCGGSCQSRFSGVYLVFEVFQDTWGSNKGSPSVYWHATLSCPLMASNCGNSYLIPISFWMPTTPWIFYPMRASRFVVFQTSGALLFLPCSHKSMSMRHFQADTWGTFGYFQPLSGKTGKIKQHQTFSGAFRAAISYDPP